MFYRKQVRIPFNRNLIKSLCLLLQNLEEWITEGKYRDAHRVLFRKVGTAHN